ncbi:tyrosine-type recombinase/integrase [Radiobacillus sp. PE A8.2]|uniref:tyrosine-type recombinase/integrase n=1 Tax=Radiobacillus sp. PE A8.2 TaxID=3380349 RepID=UPI00389117F3
MAENKNPVYRKTKRNIKNKTYTIDDARETVLKIKQLEGLTKNSIINYEKLFNDLDRFFGEVREVNLLSVDDGRNFIQWQLNEKIQFKNQKHRKTKIKGVSISSANTYLQIGKAAFEVLKNEGVVSENIFSKIRPMREKEKIIETLTINEINKLFRSMDKTIYSEFREYVICHFMLDSFARINSVLHVKKSDIDFERQAVTFQQTKNGRVHIVPLSKSTIKLIQELILETSDFNSEYLFLNVFGDRLTADTFRKHFREIVERSGLDKRVNPHLFRHTASKLFLEQNGNIRVLQKILDHSALETTSRYAHVLDKTIQEQHRQFSPVNLLKQKKKTKTRL